MGFAVRGVESDDLTHYGVKGMKWGVRKEKEITGDNLTSEKNPGDPNNEISDFEKSLQSYNNFVSEIYDNPAFSEHIGKSSEKFITKITGFEDRQQKMLEALGNKDYGTAKRLKLEMVKLGYQFQNELDAFNKENVSAATESENNFNEEWAEMVDVVSEIGKEGILAPGMTLTMEKLWDGYEYQPMYIVRGKDKKSESFKFGDESSMRSYIKNETSKNIDFRISSTGKSREKNVASTEPVKITKTGKASVGGPVGLNANKKREEQNTKDLAALRDAVKNQKVVEEEEKKRRRKQYKAGLKHNDGSQRGWSIRQFPEEKDPVKKTVYDLPILKAKGGVSN